MRRVAALILLLCAACGGGGGSEVSCPNDSTACPAVVPSYANSVAAIIQSRCVSCHNPGGQQSSIPLTTYDQVFHNRAAITTQVYSCRMPLAPSPPLTAQERAQLLGWLFCQAPNN